MIGIWFPISQGKFALVDRDLYEEVTRTKWQYNKERGYVFRTVNRQTESLHQFVMFTVVKEYTGTIDHKNREGVDCRRENLRVATFQQNKANSKSTTGSTSKYKGVRVRKTIHTGVTIAAQIMVNGRSIHLGTYDTEQLAADAYDNAAIVFFGDFANLNCSWLEER